MDEAVLVFLTAFLFTPFGSLGYYYMMFLFAYEIVFAWTATAPYYLSGRIFTLLSAVVGRILGEIVWPLVVHAGAGLPIY